MLLSQFPLTFCRTQNGIPCFIAQLMTLFVLIPMVSLIILEMFHGEISLNSALLLLLMNFVSGFRLDLMYIYLNRSIRSNLTQLHYFQQHSSQKSFFFVCTNIINLLNLKQSSDRLIIAAKGFLKLPNLHMLLTRVHHFPETWLSRLLANC